MKSTDSGRQVGNAILCGDQLRAFYIANSRDGSRAVSCPKVVITLGQRKQGASFQNSLTIDVPKMDRFLLFFTLFSTKCQTF